MLEVAKKTEGSFESVADTESMLDYCCRSRRPGRLLHDVSIGRI